MNLYAVDVETTGLDPLTSSIVSIGAVEIGNENRYFYEECSPWEGAEVHDGALKVNGFTKDYLDNLSQSESQIISKFFAWLKLSPMMCAHNSAFDKSFIQAAADRAALPNPFGFRTVDIHSIVHAHIVQKGEKPPEKLSLNECLQYFNLPKEPDPHNALTGARCNVQIYNLVTKKS
ncbi:MAG: 3'-5' exonuclease [Candidatus Pacebacteria bacterium]|nr:3'-5' exonuclease [Candidatus Paceibacterota bacterium]